MQECQLVMVIQHQVIGSLKTQNTISKRELVLHDADSADSVVPPLDAAWTWTPAGPAHATIWTCSSHNVGAFCNTQAAWQAVPFRIMSFAVF